MLTTKRGFLVQKRAELLGKGVREGVVREVKTNQASGNRLSGLNAASMAVAAHCQWLPQGGLPVHFSYLGYKIILFHTFLSIVVPGCVIS
jgi:hypothetical protein